MSTGAALLLLLQSGDTPLPVGEGWITLPEAKDHLRIDGDDQDSYVQMLIDGARAWIEQAYGLYPEPRRIPRWYTSLPPQGLLLGVQPVRDVVSVEYSDGQTTQALDSDQYRVIPNGWVLAPTAGATWPVVTGSTGAVQVLLDVGYPDRASLDQNIRMAGLLLIGHWYRNRESVSVGASVDEMPLGASALLMPYRWMLR